MTFPDCTSIHTKVESNLHIDCLMADSLCFTIDMENVTTCGIILRHWLKPEQTEIVKSWEERPEQWKSLVQFSLGVAYYHSALMENMMPSEFYVIKTKLVSMGLDLYIYGNRELMEHISNFKLNNVADFSHMIWIIHLTQNLKGFGIVFRHEHAICPSKWQELVQTLLNQYLQKDWAEQFQKEWCSVESEDKIKIINRRKNLHRSSQSIFPSLQSKRQCITHVSHIQERV